VQVLASNKPVAAAGPTGNNSPKGCGGANAGIGGGGYEGAANNSWH